MPDEIDGRLRTEAFRTPGVHYGAENERGLTLFAIPIGQLTGGAETTPLEQLVALADQMRLGLEGSSLDPGAPLAWFSAAGSLEGGPGADEVVYVATWAEPEGAWLFSVTADDSAGRTSLVHAFMDAVER
jgi:hypothetical protein